MLFRDLAEVMLAQKDLRDKTFDNYSGALRRNIYPRFANSDVASAPERIVVWSASNAAFPEESLSVNVAIAEAPAE